MLISSIYYKIEERNRYLRLLDFCMTKRRKNKKKSSSKGKTKRKSFLKLSPEAKREIGGIIFAFIFLFFLISLLGGGGKVGTPLAGFLKEIFGIGAYFLVLLFLVQSLILFNSSKGEEYSPSYIPVISGYILAFISFLVILELINTAGGSIGAVIGQWSENLIGTIGSWIFYLALFLISVSILLNKSVLNRLFSFFSQKREESIESKKDEEKPSKLKEGESKLKIKEIFPANKKQDSDSSAEKKEKQEEASETSKTSSKKGLPLDLLSREKGQVEPGDLKSNAHIIKRTLSNFGIKVEMKETYTGPAVTQYTLKPAEGVKLSRISSLQNDLALSLAAPQIRIEAPIPGKPLVGIEVPNKKRGTVPLAELVSAQEFISSPPLTIPFGREVRGEIFFSNLNEMPHLLVAGSTGSGKTVFLNSLIISLLWRNTPENLRFILIDPKRVEFSPYRVIPHLLCSPIVEHQKIIPALKWLMGEMERRFGVLQKKGARNIQSYNEKSEKSEQLPYIVLIIDELADIMSTKGKEFESEVVRLAQMSRAVGIHLILATQRPSVEVITGLIKANITSRVAFQVASQADSRTILDKAGAEKLLGKGDMLFLSGETGKPKRIQSPFLSSEEINSVANYIKENEKKEKTSFQQEIEESLEEALERSSEGETVDSEEEDELFEEAKQVVTQTQKASASLLQRRLRVGYARAARLLDMLEQKGIIGTAEGAKPREVYIDKEE